jgi:outer membrane protein assembly factor BamB
VRWTFRLVPEFSGAYVPVENAVAAFDAAGGKLYVGSTAGTVWALTQDGKPIYQYAADSPVECTPALDARADELYVGTVGGKLVVLRASDGEVRWEAKLDGPLRRMPLLSKDAVYVVTDTDVVSAFARDKGEVLWRYRREVPEGFNVTGHAGLLSSEGKLVTAFSDGMVAALDLGDGRAVWERDTSLDIEGEESLKYHDVDTTPVRFDNQIYVASFSGGLYALSARSGSVLWRDPSLTGITGLAGARGLLVITSADNGVMCFHPGRREVLWRHQVLRGSPGQPRVAAGNVFVGESDGGFVALSLRDGRELARIEFGHGFTAPASMGRGRGFVVSNGGTLFAFNYHN